MGWLDNLWPKPRPNAQSSQAPVQDAAAITERLRAWEERLQAAKAAAQRAGEQMRISASFDRLSMREEDLKGRVPMAAKAGLPFPRSLGEEVLALEGDLDKLIRRYELNVGTKAPPAL